MNKIQTWVLMLTTLIISALYLSFYCYEGWIPHDEGLLAQSAERVMNGELPYRDFAYTYTGGLAFVHAFAFALAGTSLASIRLVLFGAGLGIVALVFTIARQFASPTIAVLIALTALTWTLPNYFAALPSWYITFLILASLSCLIEFLKTENKKWLVLCGLITGLGALIKISALFFIPVCWIMAHEQSLQKFNKHSAGNNNLKWSILIILGHVLLLLAAFVLVIKPLTAENFVIFGLPLALVALHFISSEWSGRDNDSKARFIHIIQTAGLITIAALIPILLWVFYFAVQGGLSDWLYGVFILPSRRFQFATLLLPPLWTITAGLPVLLLMVWNAKIAEKRWLILLTAMILMLILGLAIEPAVYRAVWYSLRPSLLIITLFLFMQKGFKPCSRTILLVSGANWMSLSQLPFTADIYFCYISPFVFLAGLAAFNENPAIKPVAPAMLWVFYALFSFFILNPGYICTNGFEYMPAPKNTTLNLPRAGILIPENQAKIYQQLVEKIQSLTASDSYIYAAPDCPEVYFLANRKNPTRTLYDFFDDDFLLPIPRKARIINEITAHNVTAIVLGESGEFSGPIANELAESLIDMFPNVMKTGNFQVRWK